jgi:uncharacterized protein (TIGR01777 family)
MPSEASAGMTIGITGASGLVGSALAPRLRALGHRVVRLRREKGAGRFLPIAEDHPASFLPDAVIHLAGEPIASGRWNTAKKQRIRDSRVEGTRALCQALAEQAPPPRIVICASATGFYGSRGDELLDEESGPGEGFLAEVVQSWEHAASPAVECGIRVVSLRFGMILTRQGGALGKMLRPFQYGLGGRIGDGRQYWSWIALDDALGAVCHALTTDRLVGPVNVVAPQATTNAEFTAALGRVLGRPTFARLPAWVARGIFGEMADALLLASARVVPRRLTETGYAFCHGELLTALGHLLGRPET